MSSQLPRCPWRNPARLCRCQPRRLDKAMLLARCPWRNPGRLLRCLLLARQHWPNSVWPPRKLPHPTRRSPLVRRGVRRAPRRRGHSLTLQRTQTPPKESRTWSRTCLARSPQEVRRSVVPNQRGRHYLQLPAWLRQAMTGRHYLQLPAWLLLVVMTGLVRVSAFSFPASLMKALLTAAAPDEAAPLASDPNPPELPPFLFPSGAGEFPSGGGESPPLSSSTRVVEPPSLDEGAEPNMLDLVWAEMNSSGANAARVAEPPPVAAVASPHDEQDETDSVLNDVLAEIQKRVRFRVKGSPRDAQFVLTAVARALRLLQGTKLPV
jgi:hypothetical protein